MYMKSEKPPPLLIAWLDSKLGRRSSNIFDPGLCQILSNTGSGRQLVRTNPEPQPLKSFTIPGVMAAVIGNLMKINDL